MTKILPKIDFFTIDCSSFKGATEIETQRNGFVVPVLSLMIFVLCVLLHSTEVIDVFVSVFTGWRQATLDGKQLRQTILSFQAASLTRSVSSCFMF